MAIAFDTVNKIIKLDRLIVSDRNIWTAYVNWAVLSDNIKYGEIMSQVGGVAPIALYIYLENGWKIRPMEANGVTTITGNILTHDGSSPIVSTLGNWNILVNMETPVKAVAIEVVTGSGLSQAEHDKLVSLSNYTGLHAELDTYPNKADYKASSVDLTPVTNAVAALNNISVSDIEGSSVLAKEASVAAIPANVMDELV